MTEVGDLVGMVREQAEDLVQTFQADMQAGAEFIEGINTVQSEAAKLQAQLQGIADGIERMAGTMASMYDKSAHTARASSEHTVDVVRLLNAATEVTSGSDNISARAAVENIDAGYTDASNGSQLYGRVKYNTENAASFLNQVQETAGSLATKLAAFQEQTTAIRETTSQATGESESAAQWIEAAAAELGNYQTSVE